MKQMKKIAITSFCILIFTALLVLAALPGSSALQAAEGQKSFTTPDEAARALLDACRSNDDKALLDMLGPKSKPIIQSADKAEDEVVRKKFFTLSEERFSLEKTGVDRFTMVIGGRAWPFPIPIVKDGQGWRFDTAAGIEEILNRRIGRNELNAIAVCRAYVDAQREYAAGDRTGTKILQYAQRFTSTPGKKDGLYWPARPDQEQSPFGPLISETSDYHASRKQGDPYYGYYFKILTRQGANVPGGAFNYIINGHMLAGFALVAWPASYGSSGVTTFVVNQWGYVYEKDLGANTSAIAGSMNEYNPDSSWSLVKEKGALVSE
jgi:hypothetical protein